MSATRDIFICYRRDDSRAEARAIYDRLSSRWGDRVFLDLEGIDAGRRWREEIERALGVCRVFVLIIGPEWLAPGKDGRPRIHDPEDQLRFEVTTALRLRIPIIPVRVGGAGIPPRAQLPADVAAICDFQAINLVEDYYDAGVEKIIQAITNHAGGGNAGGSGMVQPPPPPPPEPALDGLYSLVSLVPAVMPPVAGATMQINSTGPGQYQFAASVMHYGLPFPFQYRGVMQRMGAGYMVQTMWTDNPSFVDWAPVLNQAAFDGVTLSLRSPYAAAVWRKQF
ncbi:MAG: toll/interleukin-1 receptor domain-containing protein [Bryobacteraceae bacterium]|nr:toll/interleukin-1 receptor domain-containing protein [Bryobacteraceae bacterium]